MIFGWTLRWPFVGLVCAIALVAWCGISWWLNRRNKQYTYTEQDVIAWDIEQELQGERITKQWKTYTTLRRATIAVMIAIGLCLSLLIARPSTINHQTSTAATRDIVLCLDVSGSTLPYDKEVIDTYLSLVNHFQGERIGLSIFNSTSKTIFPLTDDYEVVKQQLQHASSILNGVVNQDSIDKMSDEQYQDVANWLDGTQNREQATSLIGDGLVSCAAMLPQFKDYMNSTSSSSQSASTSNRSASIVFATDNILSGTPTYQLSQALDLTQRASIAVDGLYSGPQSAYNEPTTQDMKKDIESHQGLFLTQDSTSSSSQSIAQLITQIQERRGYSDDVDYANLTDKPQPVLVILGVLSVMLIALEWRLRR